MSSRTQFRNDMFDNLLKLQSRHREGRNERKPIVDEPELAPAPAPASPPPAKNAAPTSTARKPSKFRFRLWGELPSSQRRGSVLELDRGVQTDSGDHMYLSSSVRSIFEPPNTEPSPTAVPPPAKKKVKAVHKKQNKKASPGSCRPQTKNAKRGAQGDNAEKMEKAIEDTVDKVWKKFTKGLDVITTVAGKQKPVPKKGAKKNKKRNLAKRSK